MNTARRLKLRPSKPEAQAKKAKNISGDMQRRASRRMRHAATLVESKAADAEMSPEERREREATFRQWISTSFGDAAELLGENDFERFIVSARAFIFGEISHEVWRSVRAAYDLAKAAAYPPKYESPTRRWRQDHYSRPDGW